VRLGLLVRSSRTMKVVYWINVSESSGAGLPSLSLIKTVKWWLLLHTAVIEHELSTEPRLLLCRKSLLFGVSFSSTATQ